MAPSSPRAVDWVQEARSLAAPLDTSRLKRVGVATYFGVYAVIAVGGWRALVDASQSLPRFARPPAFSPLHVLLGLPRSFAWGVVSLAIAFLAVGVVAARELSAASADGPDSLDELGGSSWPDWSPPSAVNLSDRLPDRLEASLPTRLRGGTDTAATDSSTRTVEPISAFSFPLDSPSDPLSLRGTSAATDETTGPESRVSSTEPSDSASMGVTEGPGVASVDATVLVTEAVEVPRDAEILDASSDDTAGEAPREETDGGSDESPDPEAPWPPSDEDEDEDGGDESLDAEAPWPDDWIPGDEL